MLEYPAGTVNTAVAEVVANAELEEVNTAPTEVELGEVDEESDEMVVVRTTELVTINEEEDATDGRLMEDDLSTVMVLLAVE